ncbi:hypothetical protein [Bradyrhizobium sp. 6(2017)]|uniref:hypothetical protein n=1 Tax=Bradyrhizobium sp. 6(2017) TaxID=1197460 RepID=UPI0013E18EF2|nr:hypothetical protein [Bradyrhizobium sp. 6(2017)]QIG94428.1 hypothetical protein G6P99_19400 [Bradyrhizobium sp. 6(2017)]
MQTYIGLRAPLELKDALKADAAACRRTLNQHTIWLLEAALKASAEREKQAVR